MTANQLFAQLRTQLTEAAKPGLTGVRAIEAAGATLAQLEDAYRLMEQRTADREHVRLAAVVRHSMTPEQYYAAVAVARTAQPELWEGVLG